MTTETIAATEEQSANILADAKRDWRRNFAGAMITKKPEFKTPTVRHYFARQYDQLGRNTYFISIFGRVLVKGDGVAEAEAAIQKRMQDVKDELSQSIRGMKALADEAGITSFATYPLADKRDISAVVISPAQTRFLSILQEADDFLVMINTLWLENEISDQEKSKAEMEIKHKMGKIVSTVRKMRIYMQRKVNESQRALNAANSADSATTRTEMAKAAKQVESSEAVESSTTAPEEAVAAAA